MATSFGVMLGIGGAIVLGDTWCVLDPIAAVIVSVIIIKTAIAICFQSANELIDASLSDEIEAEITTNQNYYIQITFEQKEGILNIAVFNNVQIVKEEYNRIMSRIQHSKVSNNLADAYNDVYDPTEGAGLGLVLMVFLLKNSGIGADNLYINHSRAYRRYHRWASTV